MVGVPELDVVAEADEAHPQAVLGPTHLRAVHDDVRDARRPVARRRAVGIVPRTVGIVVRAAAVHARGDETPEGRRRTGEKRVVHLRAATGAARVAERRPPRVAARLLRGERRAERRVEIGHVLDRTLERLEAILTNRELAELRVHLHLDRHRRHRAHPVRVAHPRGERLRRRRRRAGHRRRVGVRIRVGIREGPARRRRRGTPLVGVHLPPARSRGDARSFRGRRRLRLGDEPADAAGAGDLHPPPVARRRRPLPLRIRRLRSAPFFGSIGSVASVVGSVGSVRFASVRVAPVPLPAFFFFFFFPLPPGDLFRDALEPLPELGLGRGDVSAQPVEGRFVFLPAAFLPRVPGGASLERLRLRLRARAVQGQHPHHLLERAVRERRVRVHPRQHRPSLPLEQIEELRRREPQGLVHAAFVLALRLARLVRAAGALRGLRRVRERVVHEHVRLRGQERPRAPPRDARRGRAPVQVREVRV